MQPLFRSLIARLSDFRKARQGASAILVAICMIPMIGFIGLAVDGARGYMAKAKLSEAVDAAGLAAGRETVLENQQTQMDRYFAANFPPDFMNGTVDGPHLSVNTGGDTLTLTASAEVPTTFMRILDIDTMTVSARTVVKRQTSGLELVLVMDNTGSMSDNGKISTMKTAAADLINIIFGNSETIYGNGDGNPPTVWVGLVPYVTTVNIGTNHESWLKTCSGNDGAGIATRGVFYWTNGLFLAKAGSNNRPSTSGDRIVDLLPDPDDPRIPAGAPYEFKGDSYHSTYTTPSYPTTFEQDRDNHSSYYALVTWKNSFSYSVGYRVVDTSVNPYTIWEAAVAHTSRSSGSFQQDRTQHPTWWQQVTCTPRASYYIDPTHTYFSNGFSATGYDFSQNVGGTNYSYSLPSGWGGCIEERDSTGRGITDDPPSVEAFNPYYWASYSGSGFGAFLTNNWVISPNNSSSNPGKQPQGMSFSISPQFDTNARGPNLNCPSPITPMTPNKSTILSAINEMRDGADRGGTLTDIGAVWGWRLISPRWRGLWGGDTPSDMPLDYHTPLMNKVVVILTDGENQMLYYSGLADEYTGHGRTSEGRLSGATNMTDTRAEIDSRMQSVCTAMKDAGIIVFTILFQESDPTAVSQFTDCATDENHYYYAPDNDTLNEAFQSIGGQLSQLRIAE